MPAASGRILTGFMTLIGFIALPLEVSGQPRSDLHATKALLVDSSVVLDEGRVDRVGDRVVRGERAAGTRKYNPRAPTAGQPADRTAPLSLSRRFSFPPTPNNDKTAGRSPADFLAENGAKSGDELGSPTKGSVQSKNSSRTSFTAPSRLFSARPFAPPSACLLPRFIAPLPHDVITTRPAHYQRTDDGQFVLYSVGWNQTDDGGEVAMTGSKPPRQDFTRGDRVLEISAFGERAEVAEVFHLDHEVDAADNHAAGNAQDDGRGIEDGVAPAAIVKGVETTGPEAEQKESQADNRPPAVSSAPTGRSRCKQPARHRLRSFPR